MKRIIICTDGTWNKPGITEDGIPIATNVEKIYNAILDDQGATQIKHYEDGVGTGDYIDKIIGGLTGQGLNQKIINAYRFIVKHFHPSDHLYLFGFSRGAYTARSLAGLIRNAGVVKNPEDVQRAFNMYRDRSRQFHPNAPESIQFRRERSHAPTEREREDNFELVEGDPGGAVGGGGIRPEQLGNLLEDHVIRIKFIGVWDTVGALGIPTPFNPFKKSDVKKYGFHDVTLTSTADHAYHAIAIDERRKQFTPTIWEKSSNLKYGSNKYVQQMWFCGVHSNVGGGYIDTGLSDLAMNWIVGKAEKTGLVFNYKPVLNSNPFGKLYDSKTFIYQFSSDEIRQITLKDFMQVPGAIHTINPEDNRSFHEYIHHSVRDRIIHRQCEYDPSNVFGALNTVSTKIEADKVFVPKDRYYWSWDRWDD